MYTSIAQDFVNITNGQVVSQRPVVLLSNQQCLRSTYRMESLDLTLVFTNNDICKLLSPAVDIRPSGEQSHTDVVRTREAMRSITIQNELWFPYITTRAVLSSVRHDCAVKGWAKKVDFFITIQNSSICRLSTYDSFGKSINFWSNSTQIKLKKVLFLHLYHYFSVYLLNWLLYWLNYCVRSNGVWCI